MSTQPRYILITALAAASVLVGMIRLFLTDHQEIELRSLKASYVGEKGAGQMQPMVKGCCNSIALVSPAHIVDWIHSGQHKELCLHFSHISSIAKMWSRQEAMQLVHATGDCEQSNHIDNPTNAAAAIRELALGRICDSDPWRSYELLKSDFPSEISNSDKERMLCGWASIYPGAAMEWISTNENLISNVSDQKATCIAIGRAFSSYDFIDREDATRRINRFKLDLNRKAAVRGTLIGWGFTEPFSSDVINWFRKKS